ncbi:MAG TPA: peptidoglycan-binding protein [Candidatus Paceibacterota bacterium]
MKLKISLATALLTAALVVPGLVAYADSSISFDKPTTGSSALMGTAFTFTATPSGLGSGITYTITDTYNTGTISSTNIDSSGKFTWTPTYSDLGMHTLTITARDTEGHSATAQFQFIVNLPTASLTTGTITPGSTVVAGNTVSFSLNAVGLSYPSYTVMDSFAGGSITAGNVSSNGNFTWTPGIADVGTHAISITGRDFRGSSANTIVTIVVTSTAAPTSVPISVPLPAPTPITAPIVGTAAPTSSSSLVFVSPLALGSKGAEVTALQNILIAQGYLEAGSNSGFFGELTKAAVQKYQTAHGLSPLGNVGPSTRAALNGGGTSGAVLGASVTVSAGGTNTMSSGERASQIATLRLVIQLLQKQLDILVAGQ